MKAKIAAVSLLAALAGWFIPPAKTVASQTKIQEVASPSNEQTIPRVETTQPKSVVRTPQTKSGSSLRHSTRAETKINSDSLRRYLNNTHSPLAEYADQILQSSYWSTIIGLCTIEQYSCSRAPGNNFWGIGPGKRFANIPDGIEAIDALLTKYEANGHDTIEELNCYYVQPCSSTWLQVVLKTKLTLESLN